MQAVSLAYSVPTIHNARRPVTAAAAIDLKLLGAQFQLHRRRVDARQTLFRAGQPMQALYLVHAGQLRTSVLSHDGREKITGFRMRGDLLGLDALGTDVYGCDAMALDYSEVWEIPRAQIDTMDGRHPDLRRQLTAAMAQEIRRDWHWMLTLATLSAEQRVADFLLDLASRQRALGFSDRHLLLRMTRAELGNFLAIQLETVTRALSRMAGLGIIAVQRRDVKVLDPDALCALAGADRGCCGDALFSLRPDPASVAA
jgi:CRP/FNR family transcriptional regulator, anaerobic regulatory protein